MPLSTRMKTNQEDVETGGLETVNICHDQSKTVNDPESEIDLQNEDIVLPPQDSSKPVCPEEAPPEAPRPVQSSTWLARCTPGTSPRERWFGVQLLVTLVLLVSLLASFLSGPSDPPPRIFTLPAVTVDGILEHAVAFERFANTSRSTGTVGYMLSGDYVKEKLENAGYNVTVQGFSVVTNFTELGPSVLTAGGNENYTYGVDFKPMEKSRPAVVTAQAVKVNACGCETKDFASFNSGSIAIFEKGDCSFEQQALNAENAGAVGAVISANQGQTEIAEGGRSIGLARIPVIASSYATGVELVNKMVTMVVNTDVEISDSFNVIAETIEGNSDQVIMAGAHLDSVPEGPGINDNGSGSAALLEIALEMAGLETANKVRLAWWGAEELGLKGSIQYVNELDAKELKKIALYLNFDMIGSKNYVRFVEDKGTSEEDKIAQVFYGYFKHNKLPSESNEMGCSSDHCSFRSVGVPSGGLFTGSVARKTFAQASKYGGKVNEPFDPCYHKPCDTIENLNIQVLGEMAGAMVHAILNFANMAIID